MVGEIEVNHIIMESLWEVNVGEGMRRYQAESARNDGIKSIECASELVGRIIQGELVLAYRGKDENGSEGNGQTHSGALLWSVENRQCIGNIGLSSGKWD